MATGGARRGSSVPSIGPALALRPARFEALFWESDVVRNTARLADGFALLIITGANLLFLRWQVHLADSHAAAVGRVLACAGLLVINMMQAVWLLRATRSYMRNRPRILLFNRSLRLLLSVLIALSARRDLAASGAAVLKASVTRQGMPLVEAYRHILNISGGGMSLFYGLLYPLPFHQQVAMQLLSAALNCAHHSSAHHILQSILDPAAVHALCKGGNTVLDLVAVALSGTSPSLRLLVRRCDSDALHTLLLFSNLYFGLVLPVYIAYRVEQQQKHAFIERLRLQADPDAEPPRRSFLLAAAFELLLGCLLAVQVWVVAVKLDPQYVMLPLEVPQQ